MPGESGLAHPMAFWTVPDRDGGRALALAEVHGRHWRGSALFEQSRYALLLKGGHVIDPKNHTSAIRDIAIRNGRVAAVSPEIAASRARKFVNVSGLYVTPGLVDINVSSAATTGDAGGPRPEHLPGHVRFPHGCYDCRRRRLLGSPQFRAIQAHGDRSSSRRPIACSSISSPASRRSSIVSGSRVIRE